MKTIIIISFLLLSFLISTAQIVYTDVWVTLESPSGTYDIDVNDDGILDYNITLSSSAMDVYLCYLITVNSYNDNYVAAYDTPEKSWEPLRIENNTNIDETLNYINFNTSGTMALGHYCYSWFFGYFPGSVDKYIGLKFSDAYGTYYGWIRVDVSSDSDWITIKDFAYDISGNSIMTSCFANMNENLSGKDEVLIYPNPAKNIVNIIAPQENFTVEIYDIFGNLQLVEKNESTIIISGLSSGTYFMKISDDDKDTYKKLVIY